MLKSNLLRAVGVLLLGILFLDMMSVIIKTLLERYAVLELSAYRNVIGVIPAFVMMWWTGEFKLDPKHLWLRQWKLAFGRGLMVTVAQVCWYAALSSSAFALVAALGYTMSLFVVILSIPILGEKVGIWRSVAVLLGFAGALLIVQPTAEGFSLWSLLPLVAAAFYALSIVSVRLFDREVSSSLMYLYSGVAAAVANFVIVLATTGFAPIQSTHDLMLIVAMGLIGGCGVICLLVSARMAEPSLLAPFNYFGLLSAFAMGWIVFGENPADRLFPGVLFIVAGGALILWRESQRKSD
ncbi:DMT family transporter [Amylibacter sp. IMCC11727]|uniref:DMT family transporter n=1 Tax=Amylibacter sp. IMCC11727 TaxID=3039851 RepID=UPI00244E202C|nr:DMT family transporter [Amylibacter sp. IMCC11727]WGI22707.1 DMT family transporter [Amylibacter sp. IMCC11727]